MKKNRKHWKKNLGIIVTLIIVLTGCGAVENRSVEAPTDGKTETPILTDKSTTSEYTDGIYEGVGQANFGTIRLSVVIESGKISSINVVESSENSQYVTTLIQQVIDAQNLSIDGISGATRTTDGVKNAIDEALSKAKS